jgi:hypothetical protein
MIFVDSEAEKAIKTLKEIVFPGTTEELSQIWKVTRDQRFYAWSSKVRVADILGEYCILNNENIKILVIFCGLSAL